MKPKSSKMCFIALGLAVAIAAIAPSSELSAVCPAMKKEDNKRGQKGERPLPAKKEARLYSQMAKKASKNEKKVQKQFGKQTPKALAQKATPNFQRLNHVLTDVSPRGDTLTIQDGSAWSVAEQYQSIASVWSKNQESGDLVYLDLSPNISAWSKIFGGENNPKYKYIVTNVKDGTYVEANLSLGPFVNNPNTRRIRKIDFSRGEIYFTSGSMWRCDIQGPAGQIFKEWKNGDYVITGVNDSWFTLWHQDIIINVSADNWIPAQRLF